MLVPVAALVVQFTKDKAAYALLKLIRKYVELDTYLSFELQTQDFLDDYTEALAEFEELLSVCIRLKCIFYNKH